MSEPSAPPGPPVAESAGFVRRLASMVYETLLVAALVLFAALLFPGAATDRLDTLGRYALFTYLVIVVGVYCVWLWHRGQTLAMRAWQLRLTRPDGRPPDRLRAAVRYLAALMLVGPALASLLWLREHPHSHAAWAFVAIGAGTIGWSLVDREGRALYDLIAGTRLVRLVKTPKQN